MRNSQYIFLDFALILGLIGITPQITPHLRAQEPTPLPVSTGVVFFGGIAAAMIITHENRVIAAEKAAQESESLAKVLRAKGTSNPALSARESIQDLTRVLSDHAARLKEAQKELVEEEAAWEKSKAQSKTALPEPPKIAEIKRDIQRLKGLQEIQMHKLARWASANTEIAKLLDSSADSPLRKAIIEATEGSHIKLSDLDKHIKDGTQLPDGILKSLGIKKAAGLMLVFLGPTLALLELKEGIEGQQARAEILAHINVPTPQPGTQPPTQKERLFDESPTPAPQHH